MVQPVADRPESILPPPSPSGPWRLVDRLAVGATIVALLVPGLLFVAGRRPVLIDNRPLLSPPPITAERLLDTQFYVALDAFLADNVSLRPTAVRLRSTLDAVILRGNVDPDVIRGSGDWLFTREELAPTCVVTAEETATAFDSLASAFAKAGEDFRVLLVPDKHVVYPEQLDPDSLLPEPCTEARRQPMRAWIAQRPGLAVDGWTPMLAARAEEDGAPGLYYVQDSHWTPEGALAVLQPFIASLDPAIWDSAHVVRDGTMQVSQELAQQQGLQRTQTVPRYRIRPDVEVVRSTIDVSVPLTNAAAIYRYVPTPSEHPVLPGRTAIVYDSFLGIVQPLVTPFFAESVWIHEGDLENHPELAAQLGSFDRVIFERVERGLYKSHVDEVMRPLVAP